MREIDVHIITEEIARLVQEACVDLPHDVLESLEQCLTNEPFAMAKETLQVIVDNAKLARKMRLPICQDTGMAVVLLEIGQDVHFVGGDLYAAIHQGVAQGYRDGYLRQSIVSDPLFSRINTKDNTPATIHVTIVPGNQVEITVAPKGFGSENMSRIRMLKPSDGVDGVKKFVLETVKKAGANACPPMVIGVGIGGNFETVAFGAKKAMLKPLKEHHQDERYAALENELLEAINQLGIGPAGFGGKTTALALHIEALPTHIAGMPVAVAICCHVARHKKVRL